MPVRIVPGSLKLKEFATDAERVILLQFVHNSAVEFTGIYDPDADRPAFEQIITSGSFESGNQISSSFN